jgi:hypothetical protein
MHYDKTSIGQTNIERTGTAALGQMVACRKLSVGGAAVFIRQSAFRRTTDTKSYQV